MPASTSAISRLPGSCIGGSPSPPVAAPAASTWRLSSARWPGSGGVRISKSWPGRAAAATALGAAHDRDRARLVEAQQLAEAQIQAAGDAAGDGERRARLAPLDL